MSIRQKLGFTPIASRSIRRNLVANQQGIYLIFSAIAVIVLFAFAAFGIEVGRWYSIQAEVSKAVDGAAFVGAVNRGNFDDMEFDQLVKDVANANFPAGMIGTENFVPTVTDEGEGRIRVDGTVTSVNPIAQVMGAEYERNDVGSSGVAKLRKFEIVLVLDESGSMDRALVAAACASS